MLIKKETLFLLGFLLLFIFIRSIHFSERLNFSADQGLFSIKALEIYHHPKLELIGPPTSIKYEGREIYQGGVIYYFLLIFLILGNFDPIKASYFFMLFSASMLIPLYFGVKKLANQKVAWLILIIYSLCPYFVNYTSFLWNPNFKLALLPIMIWLLSRVKANFNFLNIFLLAFSLGFLFQFHYGFGMVIIGLLIFLNILRRFSIKNWLAYLSGFLAGFSPILVFELRNNFYNLRTLLFFFANFNQAFGVNIRNSSGYGHYFLSITLFGLIMLGVRLKKQVNNLLIFTLFGLLSCWSLWLYLPKPTQAFRMAEDWNYLGEEKAEKIILTQSFHPFNVTNLGYDTLASVQKYLLTRDNVNFSPDDYLGNQYLYVISRKIDFENDPAYEIQAMKPFRVEKVWDINQKYKLYLLKRV